MRHLNKVPVTMSIDSTVLAEVKKTAGLIPLSRYVEDVLKRDLKAKGVLVSAE